MDCQIPTAACRLLRSILRKGRWTRAAVFRPMLLGAFACLNRCQRVFYVFSKFSHDQSLRGYLLPRFTDFGEH